jgi:hypothetical protein
MIPEKTLSFAVHAGTLGGLEGVWTGTAATVVRGVTSVDQVIYNRSPVTINFALTCNMGPLFAG